MNPRRLISIEFIVMVSPWPEYIDPGSSFILNNVDNLVDDSVAREFMQTLAAAGFGTYQAQPGHRPLLRLKSLVHKG